MRTGRPCKLTPPLQAKICELIAAGAYVETAAAYVGVSKVTLYEWMRKGNGQTTGRFRDFLNAVEKALATAEIRDIAVIGKAAQVCWTAAAWRLERRAPARWGRYCRGHHDHEGESAEEKAAEIRSLVKAMRESVPTTPPGTTEPPKSA